MPQLYRLNIVVSEDDFPLAQALVGAGAKAGWEEESLPSGDMLLRVTSEDEGECDALAGQMAAFVPEASLSRKSFPTGIGMQAGAATSLRWRPGISSSFRRG